MKSLQLRLGMGLFISLIIAFITLWWLVSSSIRYLAEESIVDHLEHDAMSILAALSIDAGNNLTLDINRIEPIYLEPFSGDYYQVITPEQVIHSRSLMDQHYDIEGIPAGQTKKLYVTGPMQQPLVLMLYGYSKLDRNITIAIAEDLSPTLGDLAHAIKTPLTVLQQLSREEALKLQPEFCAILQTQTRDMQRTMDRVLKWARLAGAGPATLKFDIQREIPVLIHVLQNIYRNKNLSITFSAPETEPLLIDREVMLELIGNLLDNACKWAKSRVTVTFNINREIHLIIEDDGPGVSEPDMSRFIQRGTRLDESTNGHGLGLSIARVIVEQHGGQLNMGRSNKLGGFLVEVLFDKSKLQ